MSEEYETEVKNSPNNEVSFTKPPITSIIKVSENPNSLNKTQAIQYIKENNLNTSNDEDKISKIFDELDFKKKGFVRKSKIIEYYTKSSNDIMETRTDKALVKLKKMKQKIKDEEILADIDWIIESIILNKWDEPNFPVESGEEIDAYKQYSKIQETLNKRYDFGKLNAKMKNNSHEKLSKSKENKDYNSEASGNTIIYEEEKVQPMNKKSKR